MTEDVMRIVPEAEGGLGWDVRVPFDGLYDALAVKRMVKLVNRRGRVRWITRTTDSRTGDIRWWLFRQPTEKIAGLNDLVEFIESEVGVSPPDGLHVSFEDRFEARKFQRDLADVALTADEVAEEQAILAARIRIADAFRREDFPEKLRFAAKEGAHQTTGYQWIQMVEPLNQDAAAIETWMRRSLEGRYWAASWLPGERVSPIKLSLRYWHLKAEQWQDLIEQCRIEPTRLLIVHFMLPTDYHAFDQRFGPSSMV